MAPVKKKKAKPVKRISEAKLRELAKKAMDDFIADAKKRYNHAHEIYKQQDADTQDALDRIIALLCQITRRNMWVQVGAREDRLVLTIPDETIYNNMFYMAVEIIKDLAVMDIRVANYKHPANLCAMCGATVKPKKKGRKHA